MSRVRHRFGTEPASAALTSAVAALILAAVAALGPAKHLQSRYVWPPERLPSAHPARLWYAPLLLSRHQPESISARLPCSSRAALSPGNHAVTVLATARDPVQAGALAVTRSDGRLLVRVGSTVVAGASVPRGTTGACSYSLVLAANRWTLSGGPHGGSRGGSLGSMPIVDSLFTGIDLRSGTPLSVVVTTQVYGTRSSTRQVILWSAAALAAVVALLLVAIGRRPRWSWTGAGRGARRVAARAGPVDAVVGVLLAGWWVIGPAFFDDGWRMASEQNFRAFGGFSTYYSSFGVSASLDWLDWSEHWLFQRTGALLVLRVPALVALAATWVLCRWILNRVAPQSAGRGLAVWALASGFVVGAFAWGMTLRPEPVVALLVTGVLACTIRFLERETAAPLAIAAVLVALAVLAHPAGLVALAPLVVAAPAIARWGRPRLTTLTTILVATASLLAILTVVGSDVHQRRADLTSLRTSGEESSGWRDELTRYILLSRALYGAPLRRAWIALAVLAVVAYVLRWRRARTGALLGLPAWSLGVGLLLLIATPSKLPWHFGALIGIAALAIAAETTRLRDDGRTAQGWHGRPFVVVGAAMLAAAWSWFPREPWAQLDLRTLQWTLGIERRLTFAKVAGAAPLVVLLGLALFELARDRRRLRAVPWRAAAWTAPVVAVPLVAFTAAVLVADTAKTTSWTLARQNIRTLAGNTRCGLADDALVPARDSMRTLAPVGSARLPVPAWLPQTPVDGLARFALGPAPGRSPWFRLQPGRRTGLFVSGVPSSSESLQLEWGRSQSGRIAPVAAAAIPGVSADDAQLGGDYWRFDAAADLPAPPPGATAVRFALRTNGGPGVAVGLTAPVTYQDEPLASLLRRDAPALALPNLRTYVPCLAQPSVAGIAGVPNAIVGFRDSVWPLGTGTSPFDGLPELYRVVRLPLSDSHDPPEDVAVYAVDRRIDGAAAAAPIGAP